MIPDVFILPLREKFKFPTDDDEQIWYVVYCEVSHKTSFSRWG